jgi:hypothetical protein
MKYVEPSRFTDPDVAARKQVEIAKRPRRCRMAASSSS